MRSPAREIGVGSRLSYAAGLTQWRERPILRRTVLLVGFLFIFAVALWMSEGQSDQSSVAHSIASGVKHKLMAGGLLSLIEAGAGAVAWVFLLVVRPIAILGGFFLVELALLGPPKSWSKSLFVLVVQVGLVLLYYFVNPLLQIVLPTGALAPLINVERAHLPAFLGPVGDLVIMLLMLAVYGFAGYWVHRAQHKLPILWRFHSVHHSIEHLDALSDVSHPFDAIGGRIGIILISAVIGFDYEAFAWILAIRAIRGGLQHTRAPINFGPFGAVFFDNRHHFAHHSVREKYYDCNFGGLLSVYDRMFGTYVPPESDVLEETGMISKYPPRSLWQFCLARLEDRPAADGHGREVGGLALAEPAR